MPLGITLVGSMPSMRQHCAHVGAAPDGRSFIPYNAGRFAEAWSRRFEPPGIVCNRPGAPAIVRPSILGAPGNRNSAFLPAARPKTRLDRPIQKWSGLPIGAVTDFGECVFSGRHQCPGGVLMAVSRLGCDMAGMQAVQITDDARLSVVAYRPELHARTVHPFVFRSVSE